MFRSQVSCIAMNGSSTLLASGQAGAQSMVRVWDVNTTECFAMFKTHAHSLHCLRWELTSIYYFKVLSL